MFAQNQKFWGREIEGNPFYKRGSPQDTDMKTAGVLFFSLLLAGCTSHEAKRIVLHPASTGPPGYSRADDTGIFENDLLRISVRYLDRKHLPVSSPLLDRLADEGYVVFAMEIMNKSSRRVIFNPVHTAMMDNAMGYKKPLDYTALYLMARDTWKDTGRVLSPIKNLYYDLSTTVNPEDRVKKMLIFPPPDAGSTRLSLVIKELYIGTETMDLIIPFRIIPAGD